MAHPNRSYLASLLPILLLLLSAKATAHSGHSSEFQQSSSTNQAVKIDSQAAQQLGISTTVIKAQPFEIALKATGIIELAPSHQATITAPVKGKIVSLLAEPGARVRSGQPLATVTSAELVDLRTTSQEKRAEMWANLQQAKTNLQLAENNERRSHTIAAAELQRAKDSLAAAQSQYNRDLFLVKDRSVVQAARENYQRQQAIAQSEIAQAQTEVNAALERHTQDQRLAANGALPRRQMLESQAQLSAARTKLAKAQQQPEVLVATSELRKAEADLPIRAQQESATKLAEARANLVTIATQRELLAAEAELQRSQAALTAAQDKFDLADRSYSTRLRQLGTVADPNGLVTIQAPIDGTLVDRPVTIGQTVVEGETKLMTLANNNALLATAQIYERDLPRVTVGQAVNVRVAGLGNQILRGTISRIGSQVDERRTVAVQALLENSASSLKAGMFAELEVITGQSEQPVVSIPHSALVEANGKKQVYVQSGNKFQPVVVNLGQTSGDRVEVKTGLFAGDRVVTQGAMSLYAQSLRGNAADDHQDHGHDHQGKEGTAKIPATQLVPVWAWPVAGGIVIGSLGIWQYRRRKTLTPDPLATDIDRAITAILLEDDPLPQMPSADTEESISLPENTPESSPHAK
jgi:membrane fusion protein, heavy metal efflux system